MMEKSIELGIGFVTGRSNVCNIINNYYKNMLEQISKLEYHVNITLFVLFDLEYQGTERIDFYKIIPAVYKDINVRYITPEKIEEEKKRITAKTNITYDEINLLLGNGHARGRNTLMHFAYRDHMDYLLFWDDDEYPLACINDNNKIIWKPQENINMHLKNINNADVTIGYHCGYVSPIPYIDFKNEIDEQHFRNFIEAVSNDILSWESIKYKMQNDNGVTYANPEIANENGLFEVKQEGAGKWVAGSTLCLNLRNIENIPAFYNPMGARGEDTFFATKLNDSKVLKVPVYHFHDGFLKYPEIMLSKYPEILEKADNSEKKIEKRFFKASIGWIRYKPLLLYISDKKNYTENIQKVYNSLKSCINAMNDIFQDYDFTILLDELTKYSKNVEKDYEEYKKTNNIWNKLKK